MGNRAAGLLSRGASVIPALQDADASRAENAQTPHGLNQSSMSQAHRTLVLHEQRVERDAAHRECEDKRDGLFTDHTHG